MYTGLYPVLGSILSSNMYDVFLAVYKSLCFAFFCATVYHLVDLSRLVEKIEKTYGSLTLV